MRRPTIGRPAREPAIVALRFPAATGSQRLRNNALAVHAIESSRLAPGRRRVICARLATRTRCGRGGRAVEGARLESVYAGDRIAGSNPAPSAKIGRAASELELIRRATRLFSVRYEV